MDAVFDFIAEFFIEFFVEGFLSLCELFIPQKIHSQKVRKIIHIGISISAFAILIIFFWGIFMQITAKGASILGWIFIAVGITYLLTGITLKIISHKKKKNDIQSWIDGQS